MSTHTHSPIHDTLSQMAEKGSSVVTVYFSNLVFTFLKARYRDDLALIVITFLCILWIQTQRILTLLLLWLREKEDDPRWLEVWRRFFNFTTLVLMVLWGQYIIILIQEDVMMYHISYLITIFFVGIILVALFSFLVDNPSQFSSEDEIENIETAAHFNIFK